MSFANDIMALRYSWTKEDGTKETWGEIAERVVKNVFGTPAAQKIHNLPDIISELIRIISERKFIPGGRFLAQSGREYHQTNNCLAGETRFITRYGLRTLEECSGKKIVLLTSGGKWVLSDIQSFGKQFLYEVKISKGKTKKSIFATENHRWMISKSKGEKNRSLHKCEKTTLELNGGDNLYQVFGYGVSRNTPGISGIQHGIVFGDGTRESDEHGFSSARVDLCGDKNTALKKYFPGFKISERKDRTVVLGLPRLYKDYPSLENDRNYLYGWLVGYFAADGCVSDRGVIILSSAKRRNLELARDVCYVLGIGTNSISEQKRISNLTGKPSDLYKITLDRETLSEEFFIMEHHKERFKNNTFQKRTFWRVDSVNLTDRFETVYCAVVPKTHEFVLEDNILTGNCFLLRATDTREGWGELTEKATRMLMSGGGIGVDYSSLREKDAPLKRSGGVSSGPIPLMKVINEIGRGVMSGGSRRSAIWAGLSWNHPDIMDFIELKNWPDNIKKLKEKDFDFPAAMDMTNISVILDRDFFDAYENPDNEKHKLAKSVYWKTVESMCKTGEPGFSVNYENKNESLRNA